MKVLSRYLLVHFSRILALCAAAFIGIYLLIDFFEKVDDFIDHKASAWDYLTYLLNSIPFIFVQILPLAILTAVVLTLGGLGRTNEVTAMRACGISLWKIVQPLMALALVLSFTLLLLNEFVIPWNAKQLNRLLEYKLKGKQQLQLTRQEIWYRNGRRIINIALASPQKKSLEGITIFTFDEQQDLVARTTARQAFFSAGSWQSQEVIKRTFAPATGDLIQTEVLSSQALQLERDPEDFFTREDINSELNFRQLSELARKLEAEGYDATHQRVDMHNRLAAPFTCLIMGFLGVPFALQKGRKGNIALGIGISLAIGIVYFIIQSLVTAFGYSSALPPIFAAWTANFIFLLSAVWLLLNVRE
ncbi:MAG: LPS export ABC transporter permease LptG [Desulfuromonadales bacterium]|nr:LPS export ABC transporter permease LptG [Desulfuromonadales bacterium]MBN2791223.1 LPS export ABC transporter permease LptG [Desulfuromonadales bacterium]